MNNSLTKNVVFNVGYKVLNVLFPLITSVYVSRILGPEGIGRVNYAQNILSYFLIFASVGIPTYGIREIAKYRDDTLRKNETFSELFLVNATTTTFCLIIYLFAIYSIPSFKEDRSVFLAAGVSLFLNYFNIDWFYSGLEEFVYISIRSTVVKILAIIAMFLFVKEKKDVVNYAVISSLGVSLNYTFNLINLRHKVKITFINLHVKKHLRPIVILLLTMLATDLYNQIDITMIGGICSKSEVGHYSLAIRLVRIITAVTTAVSATMLPRFSRYFAERNMVKLNAFANKIMSVVILMSLPCSVGIYLCSERLIYLMYGVAFGRSAGIIKILCPIMCIISVSYLCGSITLTAVNKEKCLLYATFSGAAVNILLNSILIPSYRGYGAAVASVISEIVVLVLHFLFSKNDIRYRFLTRDNLFVGIACIVMAVYVKYILSLVNGTILSILISVIGGASIYFVVLLIFKHTMMIEGYRKVKLLLQNRCKTDIV